MSERFLFVKAHAWQLAASGLGFAVAIGRWGLTGEPKGSGSSSSSGGGSGLHSGRVSMADAYVLGLGGLREDAEGWGLEGCRAL